MKATVSFPLRHLALGFALFTAPGASPVLAEGEKIVMYQHPQCGCCGKWADHLRGHGFTVEVIATREMSRVRSEAGVPRALGSCHTATVGGYVVEGHVPVADVQRLLAERPPVAGIAAPGMPLGSPGMEGPYPADHYNVIGFDAEGNTQVFASH